MAPFDKGSLMMRIWVDAVALPVVFTENLYRAAVRREIPVTLVANQPLRTPPSPWIKSIQVASGFDVADHLIVQNVEAGDLVVTADIPLAAEVVEKGGEAINPRGQHYTRENIRQRLAMRNFMEEMRSIGEVRGGPAAFNQADRQTFANALDRWLARARRPLGACNSSFASSHTGPVCRLHATRSPWT